MIKSRYNTFESWIIISGLCLFFIVFVISIYSIYSDTDIFSPSSDTKPISVKIYLYLSLLGLAIFIFIAYKIKIVFIDYLSRQIITKNFITRKTLQYSFSELDGYYDIAVNHSGKQKYYSKAVGISKDKKIILIIDSYYCSNLSELRDGLDKLKYLGADINWKKQNF